MEYYRLKPNMVGNFTIATLLLLLHQLLKTLRMTGTWNNNELCNLQNIVAISPGKIIKVKQGMYALRIAQNNLISQTTVVY